MDVAFFDFDGTLCDTRADILATYQETFARLGIVYDQQAFRIGPPLADCVREVLPDAPDTLIAEIARVFQNIYDDSGFPQTVPYAGVVPLLNQLREDGATLFIATNKRLCPMRKIMEKFDMLNAFREFYTIDTPLPAGEKGKAGMLRTALARHGFPPDRCVMIGDTVGDIRAGAAAGMKTLAVSWGYETLPQLEAEHPDFIAIHPSDIPAILTGQKK